MVCPMQCGAAPKWFQSPWISIYSSQYIASRVHSILLRHISKDICQSVGVSIKTPSDTDQKELQAGVEQQSWNILCPENTVFCWLNNRSETQGRLVLLKAVSEHRCNLDLTNKQCRRQFSHPWIRNGDLEYFKTYSGDRKFQEPKLSYLLYNT